MKKLKDAFSKIPEELYVPILLIVFPVVACAVLGLVFGSIVHCILPQERYIQSVWMWVLIFFFFAGFPLVIHAVLLFVTGEANFPIGFSIGLYFGTIFLAEFLREFIITEESNLYIISFVIVALICYIIWCTHFRKKKD